MNTEKILDYYCGIERLKQTRRKGWEIHRVPNVESVADHVFGVMSLSLLFAAKRKMNIADVLVIGLIHEVCEIALGDITPHDGVSESDKQKAEESAARSFLEKIDPTGHYFELWMDFEHQRTPEGKLVKNVDRLEMVCQAFVYENRHDMRLDEFYEYVKKRVNDPELIAHVASVIEHREKK
ncbi:MAG: HD domain-containing protein [Phycisphaerales bacterium]|nr:HD domain-containing protein [Phycisphaerales bacterium]